MLHFHPALAPYKAAVLPLSRTPPLVALAQEVHQALRRQHHGDLRRDGAIGRRYRRQDEIGTPYCLTVDFQSLEDRTVTVRDRDSMEQIRAADRGASRLAAREDRRLTAPGAQRLSPLQALVQLAAKRSGRRL